MCWTQSTHTGTNGNTFNGVGAVVGKYSRKLHTEAERELEGKRGAFGRGQKAEVITGVQERSKTGKVGNRKLAQEVVHAREAKDDLAVSVWIPNKSD